MNREIIGWLVIASFFVYLFFFTPIDFSHGEPEKVRIRVAVVNATFVPAHSWCTVPSQYCYFMNRQIPDAYRTEFICDGKRVISYDRDVYNSSLNMTNRTVEAWVNRTEVTGYYLILPESKNYDYSIIKLS